MTAATQQEGAPADIAAAAARSRAWPFEEARRILARAEGRDPAHPVLFETGYGPSGLPHIGTFSEVARTSMVRHAFRVLTEDRIPTRLLCFADDMDGLRKVPDNVPDREAMAAHLGKPLTAVPDPFGRPEGSFGRANTAQLRGFLDRFGFDYEFASATDLYRDGRFDAALRAMLAAYDDVMEIILPTLGPERRATYSPFLPIHPETGIVLQVPIVARDVGRGTVVYRDPATGAERETTVTGGAVKCQWKADWALRWTALGVNYEMAGKDLIDSVRLSSRICRAIGGTPPESYIFELFLDENGQKISKSRGNGLTIEEWLAYASPASLAFYMYQRPSSARRLHFDVIPRAVDDYWNAVAAYPRQSEDERLGNPVWHIHDGLPPAEALPVSFAMLLNLVSASHAHTRDVLWGFITRHVPGVARETHPALDALVGHALRYYEDFVRPHKRYRAPDDVERAALAVLDARLAALPADADAEAIQGAILDVGRAIERYQDHARTAPGGGPGVSGDWFAALYQILLGQERGPRFGSFVQLFGVAETRALIADALAGRLG